MPHYTPKTKAEVRALWESGDSLRALADRFSVSLNTLSRWKKQQGWKRADDLAEQTLETERTKVEAERKALAEAEMAANAEAARAIFAGPDDDETDDEDETDTVNEFAESDDMMLSSGEVSADELIDVAVEERLAEAEAEIVRLRAERDALTTEVNLDLPATVEAIIDLYGRDWMLNIAETKMNAERRARGFNSIELNPDSDRAHKEIVKAAEVILEKRERFSHESNLRTFKMAKRDPNSPGGWRIVGLPFEPQINNEAGNPGASMRRYQAKGFKAIVPALCHRGPCSRKAAQANGRFFFDGYCSQEHRDLDPFLNAGGARGVTTTAHAMVGAPSVKVG